MKVSDQGWSLTISLGCSWHVVVLSEGHSTFVVFSLLFISPDERTPSWQFPHHLAKDMVAMWARLASRVHSTLSGHQQKCQG
jgi:hypothetical protein